MLTACLYGCGKKLDEVPIYNESCVQKDAALATCIDAINIIYPPPSQESPDRLELYIASSDTALINVLLFEQVEEALFQEEGVLTEGESKSGSGLRVSQIGENYFKLSYLTSYFRGYPIDTVKEEGTDYIDTAQLVLTRKHSKKWIIKTCSQTH